MCAKRLAEELNEGFIEDYSTPSKKPRTEQLDTPSRRQKNSYTLEFKLKLVEEAKKLSIAAISKRHSIDRRPKKGVKRSNLAGQGRKVANEEMEEAVYQWIVDKRNNSMHVSRNEICRKAKELSMDCSFLASQQLSCHWTI